LNRYGAGIDKNATKQEAIAQLQRKFAGQAEAYGKTAAGAQERFGVAVENLQERIGSKLLPVVARATNGVADFVGGMESGKGAGGRFASAIGDGFDKVRSAVNRVRAVVSAWVDQNRSDINSAVNAFKTVGRFAKDVFQDTVLPIVRRVMKGVGEYIDGLVHVVRGLVRIVSGLLSGDWSKAWSGAKEVVSGAFKAIKAVVVTMAGNLWEIVKDLGPKLVKGIVRGLANMGKALAQGIFEGIKAAARAVPGLAADVLKGLGHAITGAIGKGLGKLNIFGGTGDGIGMTLNLPKLGSFGGSLQGADPAMAPFAGIASGYGLSIAPGGGKRPEGTRTASGGVSWHGSGRAIDESGAPSQMMAFFKAMKQRFGSILAELIYTPGGVGIKNGRPFRYTGAVAADHYDHVHVAYAGPAIGDGLGHAARTGDGIGFRGLEDLWVRAGGTARLAPLMAHIAQAESGGDPTAHNPSGATGLWQILGKPFPGNALDPLTNAKMAVWKYQHQGLGAWAASRGTWGRYVGSGETYTPSSRPISSGGATRTTGAPSRPRSGTDTFTAQDRADMPRDDPADVSEPSKAQQYAMARAGTPYLPPLMGAKGIKGQTQQQADDLAAIIQARAQAAADRDPGWTHEDEIRSNIARSQLTGSRPDEILYTTELRDFLKRLMDEALADNDPRNDPAAIGAYKDVADAVKALTGAADNSAALADQMKGLQDEMKRTREFAEGVRSTSEYQLTETISALVSGHIVGRGLMGRSFTPGAGTEYLY
jgi:hypothetical protein